MDIAYLSAEIECPNCGHAIEIVIKQAMAEEVIICPGCHTDIKLVDDGGTIQQAEHDIDQALQDLERRLRRLGG